MRRFGWDGKRKTTAFSASVFLPIACFFYRLTLSVQPFIWQIRHEIQAFAPLIEFVKRRYPDSGKVTNSNQSRLPEQSLLPNQ
jgi:hypothetical protein